jgi:hypothetical protein
MINKVLVSRNRMVLDCKWGGVSAATQRRFRGVLPRATDLVNDALELASDMITEGDEWVVEDLIFFILDIVGAFFLVPLRHSERRFFTAIFRKQIYIWLRTAQGSRGGPLSWAILFALVCRLTQSAMPRKQRRRAPECVRLEAYVDDPAAVVRGTPAERRSIVVLIVTIWLCSGSPSPFRRANTVHGSAGSGTFSAGTATWASRSPWRSPNGRRCTAFASSTAA